MAEKRYYWIKLKDTFMTSDTVDFLMGQKNGANYVVLYQMLCLKTANTNGELARKIGEIIIPYDAEKIQRDCKYFDIDTIRVALELYKQLGLIYKQEDSILKIANFENMVGSETAWAEKKRIYREKQDQLKIEEQSKDNVLDNVLDNFRQEKDIRYKRLDIRDIDNIEEYILSSSEEKIGQMPIGEQCSPTQKPNIYKDIIDYLNEKAGTNYRYTTKSTQRYINGRLNEKFTLNDFKTVIDKKSAEWKYDPNMCKYLRPETLFGTKFESYLNENSKPHKRTDREEIGDKAQMYRDIINRNKEKA